MSNKIFNPLLNEVLVFRPTDDSPKGIVITTSGYDHKGCGLLRYADGKWIPDDGKPDLAFVHGVFAYGVGLPYSTNILWSWRDIDLSRSYLPKDLHSHTRGWHSQTIGNTHWEDYWWGGFGEGRDKRPNTLAQKSAMDKCCALHGCANGRGPDLTLPNVWIERGLLWIKSTMLPIKPPQKPVCFLCLNNGKGHLLEALESKKSELEGRIEYDWESHNKAEIDAIDYKSSAESAERCLKDTEQEIQDLA